MTRFATVECLGEPPSADYFQRLSPSKRRRSECGRPAVRTLLECNDLSSTLCYIRQLVNANNEKYQQVGGLLKAIEENPLPPSDENADLKQQVLNMMRIISELEEETLENYKEKVLITSVELTKSFFTILDRIMKRYLRTKDNRFQNAVDSSNLTYLQLLRKKRTVEEQELMEFGEQEIIQIASKTVQDFPNTVEDFRSRVHAYDLVKDQRDELSHLYESGKNVISSRMQNRIDQVKSELLTGFQRLGNDDLMQSCPLVAAGLEFFSTHPHPQSITKEAVVEQKKRQQKLKFRVEVLRKAEPGIAIGVTGAHKSLGNSRCPRSLDVECPSVNGKYVLWARDFEVEYDWERNVSIPCWITEEVWTKNTRQQAKYLRPFFINSKTPSVFMDFTSETKEGGEDPAQSSSREKST